MQPLPHRYQIRASGTSAGTLNVQGSGLPDLDVAAPAEFDGPGDVWSPETLLAATVASCLILTFRSIAKASRFAWTTLDCDVDATLEKTADGIRFTTFAIRAQIGVPDSGGADRARRLLEKAERACLVTQSLRGETRLEIDVRTSAQRAPR